MTLKPILVFVTVFATATASIQPAAAWSTPVSHGGSSGGVHCKTGGGVTVNKNVNIYKPVNINKSVQVDNNINIYKPVTIQKDINIYKPVTVNNDINITKNIDDQKNININNNVQIDKNIDINKNVTINKSIVINKGGSGGGSAQAEASAWAAASANASASASAGSTSYSASYSESTVINHGGGGEIGAVAAQETCQMQEATIVKALHVVCVTAEGREFPASHMLKDTWIESSYEGEVARCIPGATVKVIIGDVVQSDQGMAGTYSSGQVLACGIHEALRHYKDGMLKCAPAVPVKDCTERTNLRLYGTGDLFFSYRGQVCATGARQASESGVEVTGMTLDGGVGDGN
jgi:hypothetical protein